MRLLTLFCLALLISFDSRPILAQTRLVRKAIPINPADVSAPENADQPGKPPHPENPTQPDFVPPEPGIGVAEPLRRSQRLSVYPPDAPTTIASSAIMVDARKGSVLYLKNPDAPRPVASTQKLLTALLIVEHGGLDDRVRVAFEDCAVEPTKLGFRPGEIYTKRQLLGAMLVHSCNDAALCLARNDAGSVGAFARLMNARAASLGAFSSHFVNPNGLPRPGQYSTARDMAKIAFAAYHNPTLRFYMGMPGINFEYNTGRVRFLEPTNKLVMRSAMFTGMKTGYTDASGRCLISSATGGDRDVILVQLGGTHHPLFDDAQRLLTWGLDRKLSGLVNGNSQP